MPAMSSWPTRWAAVIRAKTWAAQESGWRVRGGREASVVTGRAEAVLAEVPGGPAA
jgi:hypothetical protein